MAMDFSTKDKYLIALPCFRRPNGLKRILNILKNLRIEDKNKIYLVISIDGEGSNDLHNIAKNINIGIEHKVIVHSENIGLKKHIIYVSDMVKDFKASLIVEDDILLSEKFFKPFEEIVKLINLVPEAVGGSLYTPGINELTGDNFYPLKNSNDFYTSSVASSWGQIWVPETWKKFKEWMQAVSERDIKDSSLPNFIKKWPSSSWKKYLYLYLQKTSQKIIYLYDSYATNTCDDGGFHAKSRTSRFQVSMPNISNKMRIYHGEEQPISYDCHYNLSVEFFADILDGYDNVIVDLYSTKDLEKEEGQYVLTCEPQDLAIKKFPSSILPIELNMFYADYKFDHIHSIFLVELKNYKKNNKNKNMVYSRNIKVNIFSLSFIQFFVLTALKKLYSKLRNLTF